MTYEQINTGFMVLFFYPDLYVQIYMCAHGSCHSPLLRFKLAAVTCSYQGSDVSIRTKDFPEYILNLTMHYIAKGL